jgi:hypothetical protein
VVNHDGNGTTLIGDNHVVADSEVANVGCMGVSVMGGNRTTLTGGMAQVLRNEIHHFSLWKRTYQSGIFWAGVGHVIDHNHIYFAPHNAVLGGANEDTNRGGNNLLFINNLIEWVWALGRAHTSLLGFPHPPSFPKAPPRLRRTTAAHSTPAASRAKPGLASATWWPTTLS